MDNRDNINAFRKKRARRRRVFGLAVLMLVVLVIALIAVNWTNIIAPLRDAALDVGKGGFPVNLPGSAGYVLDSLGDSFCLLTDTYLYTYNSEGALIADIQHGFQNPVSSVNDRRVLIYDKNGKDFRLYSRTAEIYTRTLEDSIVFAEIGSSDRCAVVTTSSRYSNYLYVFNGEGRQIFRWASPDYKIMRAEFSDDDNSIYVSVTGASGGELRLYILRFDLDNAESHVWQTYIGGDITYSLECCRDGLYVVTGGGILLLDEDSGEITERASFTRDVVDIPPVNGVRSVLLGDTASNGSVLCVYDGELAQTASLLLDSVTSVRTKGGRLYVLSGSALTSYDAELNSIREYELDDVYSDMIIMGGSAYLLGYNAVQRVEL